MQENVEREVTNLFPDLTRNKAAMKNFRTWGNAPYSVAVIHGGPGAAGEMAPVAREISRTQGIIEPFQTDRTVTGQVTELKKVLAESGRPAGYPDRTLVGSNTEFYRYGKKPGTGKKTHPCQQRSV